MNQKVVNVIAFSYAKRALTPCTRERLRMEEYTEVLDSYHVIVFTHRSENYPILQTKGNFQIYATNSRTKIGMIFDAYRIAKQILTKQKEISWIVSAQDALASSIPAVLLASSTNASLHIQMHGDLFSKEFFHGDAFGFLKRLYAQWVIRRAKKVRVVSKRIKQSLLELGISEKRIIVLPIQSDTTRFLEAGENRVYSQMTHTRFLYVGRFSAEKNLLGLLRAFALALREGMVGSLTLLGDGPEKQILADDSMSLKIDHLVNFHPWTDDVAGVMAQSDVFCLSSFHEGYAMVLVEAMSAGLPIITTDVGCVGDVIIHEKNGLVITTNNADAYAAALHSLSLDKHKQKVFGRNNYESARSLLLFRDEYLHAIRDSFML